KSASGLPTCARARVNFGGIFDFDAKKARLSEIEAAQEDPAVWNDAERAQALGRERKSLEAVVTQLGALARGLDDAQDLFEMGRAEEDDAEGREEERRDEALP
ncbi:MAG TPA: PCRF domain-containing protein, partial [Rhodocyclaceae bacterium]|nr:PCRF domain-containing protein [Rhodocyclaceae bacterium]